MAQHKEKPRAKASAVWRIYWSHTKECWPLWILIVVGMLGQQVATLVAPLIMKQLFNNLALGISGGLAGPMTLLVLLVVVWLFGWVMLNIFIFSLNYSSSYVMERLGGYAFERLIGHSHDFFSSSFSGALTHKVNKFSRAYDVLTDSIIQSFVPAFIFILSAVVILSFYHFVVGMTLLVWVIAMFSLQLFLSWRHQSIRVQLSEADTKGTATIADAISNHASIQYFSGASYENGLVKDVLHAWRTIALRLWNFDMFTWASISFMVIVIQSAILGIALYLWAHGLFTVGDFVLVQLYLFTTFDRLNNINRQLRSVYNAYADAAEMTAIIETPYGVQDVPDAPALAVSEGRVVFDTVSFRFHHNNPVLTDFNLTIAHGERIALVGPSGAGKSTVTKLLLRLYDVSSGAITIDGHNIAHVTQESVRNAVAFVPQDPALFHRSLMENIRYGKRDATDAEVLEAAKQAHCHEFISRLSDGYNTLVGERGIKLSGGERQRVAIARAILKNAPILVLDEATSALDSESEMLIQDALRTLMAGKTVVVIAHRLSTIMNMDRIIVIENGRVADTGTHAELIGKDGLYKKLWDIQAGGFIGGEEDEEDEE